MVHALWRAGRALLLDSSSLWGWQSEPSLAGWPPCRECSDNKGTLPCFPSGFGYGALAGAFAGGVVGALIHPDRWSRVVWPPQQ